MQRAVWDLRYEGAPKISAREARRRRPGDGPAGAAGHVHGAAHGRRPHAHDAGRGAARPALDACRGRARGSSWRSRWRCATTSRACRRIVEGLRSVREQAKTRAAALRGRDAARPVVDATMALVSQVRRARGRAAQPARAGDVRHPRDARRREALLAARTAIRVGPRGRRAADAGDARARGAPAGPARRARSPSGRRSSRPTCPALNAQGARAGAGVRGGARRSLASRDGESGEQPTRHLARVRVNGPWASGGRSRARRRRARARARARSRRSSRGSRCAASRRCRSSSRAASPGGSRPAPVPYCTTARIACSSRAATLWSITYARWRQRVGRVLEPERAAAAAARAAARRGGPRSRRSRPAPPRAAG